jgi:Zn-dependent peptidase ImmA (M78 family)/DNA-binding XRE family transcriptional regulator
MAKNDGENFRSRLGISIRTRRTTIGFSQDALAKATKIGSGQIISQIEKGERDVKAHELFVIAQALYCSPSELLEEQREGQAVAWRKKPETGAELEKAKLLHLCSVYHLVEQWTGEDSFEENLPRLQVGRRLPSFDWAERQANFIRKAMELGNYPALTLKKTLEERFSVKIFTATNFQGSAASTWGQFGNAIILNANDVSYRKNYSLAHELFHLLTWESLKPTQSGELCLWEDKIEQLAEKFASCLLLPEDRMRERLNQYGHGKKTISLRVVSEIAEEYDVSRQAIIWRLYYLKAILYDKAKELIEECSSVRVMREESIEADEDLAFPHRFVRLLKLAYLQGTVGSTRVSEILERPLLEVRTIIRRWEEEDCGAETNFRLA